MKNLFLVFLLPLFVTIVGSNSRLQYGDCELSKLDSIASKKPEEVSKSFNLVREINFVNDDFVCTGHKWYIRFLGVFLIFFPFIPNFLPVRGYFEERANELAFILRNVGSDVLGQIIRRKAVDGFTEDINLFYGLYILLYNVILICIAIFLNFPPANYSLLLYERSLNFVAWLI